MSDYEFANVEHLKRDLAIEGETGTELGLEGGITLIVLAASDANPRWKARREQIRAELNRLSNAKADGKRSRDYLAGIYAETIVKGWHYIDADGRRHAGPLDKAGNAIPFSRDACKAFLQVADDAYSAVDAIIYDTKNFRGARIEAAVERVGNS